MCRKWLLVVAVALLGGAALATASSIATSAGALVVDSHINLFGAWNLAGSTGNLCTYAMAGAVMGAFAGTSPGVPCVINVPPGRFAGAYGGTGILAVPKFPPPPGTGAAETGTMTATALGPAPGASTTSTASAGWTSVEYLDPIFGRPVGGKATLNSSASVVRAGLAQWGIAIAASTDPWDMEIFTELDLDLTIDLLDVALQATADPGERSAARIVAQGAFGRGSVPGSDPLRSWYYSHELVHNDSFSAGLIPLLHETLHLTPGHYWLLAELQTGADGDVPEPGAAVLGLSGVLLLGLLRWLRPRG